MDTILNEHLEHITNRLMERTATLFLGAGVNANIRNAAGATMPLGNGLSNLIAEFLLKDPALNLPLTQTAQLAKSRLGDEQLNLFLYELLTTFRPGTAHISAIQLPWDSIFTTNYDLLLETAGDEHTELAFGPIVPILSQQTDISVLPEQSIPYYKLHGSIDQANTPEGRLIITQSDYFHYDKLRVPMFARLRRDLTRRTFVFAGYSLTDSNFLQILEQCKQLLEIPLFPPSYAVKQSFSASEAAYWKGEYNIKLIGMDAEEFLTSLKESWVSQQRMVVPLEQRQFYEYLQVDKSAQFPRVGDSFVQVATEEIQGQSDPKAFFNGREATWADIRDGVAPKRDQYWTLLSSILDELTDPSLPSTAYLVAGAAGNGKTTLLRTLCFDLVNEFSDNCQVYIHIPSTPLDLRAIKATMSTGYQKRPVILIRHAGEYAPEIERLLREADSSALPVTLLLEERRNQWEYAANLARISIRPVEFEIGTLQTGEIDNILDALTKYDCLGKLTGTPRLYQFRHFASLAHRELLVSLRELTSETSFDRIIEDEYDKIPSPTAKAAYVYVAALGQFELDIRYETIMHILQIGYEDLGPNVFGPAKGILLSGEETGHTRITAGFRLTARHPVIASIVFSKAAPSDDDKLEVVNRLLTYIDPGQQEDRYLLDRLIRTRELVDTISDPAKRRSIYDRYEAILPGDPFVLQQRSMLERDLNASDDAVSYARKAIRLRPSYAPFLNTLGLALEHLAREVRDPIRHQSLLDEASTIFDNGIRNTPNDSYSYLGKYYVLRQLANDEIDPDRRQRRQAAVISLLTEAFEATDENPVIARPLAIEQSQLGDRDQALKILRQAIESDPSDSRIRDLLILYTKEAGDVDGALALAYEGTKYDATNWRLQRHIARLLMLKGGTVDAIKGHLESAIRHRRGDINLLVELGAYLFENGRINESVVIFNQARNLPISAQERRHHRRIWRDENGARREFTGVLRSIRGGVGTIRAIPDNFEVTFWMNSEKFGGLRTGDRVSFTISYNAYGANAIMSI